MAVSVRNGTENRGYEYELKLLALWALRCVKNRKVKDAWFTSNTKHVNDFDDVVLYVKYREDNSHTAYLIQLKQENKNKSLSLTKDRVLNDTGNFSLKKYEKSYIEIKKNIDDLDVRDGLIENLRSASRIWYVIYTNKPLSGKKCDFLNSYNLEKREKNLLDTSDSENNIYNFNLEEINPDFLNQLLLFCKQVHVSKVNDFIKKELLRIGQGVITDSTNTDELARNYVDFVGNCIRCNDNSAANFLSKADLEGYLMSSFLVEYKVQLPSFNDFNYQQFAQWDEMVGAKSLIVQEATESVTNFLKDYLSAKIRDQISWNKDLDKNRFYEKNPELQLVLKRIVGESTLTLSKIYDALWLLKKVPLLVQVKSKEELERVQATLRLSCANNYQVIVLVFQFSVPDAIPNFLINFNDLEQKHQELILKRKIALQTRVRVELSSVVDESMYDLIKIKDVIEIVTNKYTIGGAPGQVLEYYVARSVFDADGALPLEKLFEKNVCVLSACERMGKTEFFNHVALTTSAHCWIINVALNNHVEYLKKLEKYDIDHFYVSESCSNQKLTEQVFSKLKHQKKILVMLDAFDKVAVTYKEQVIALAKSLVKSGFKIWISTRPIYQSYFEKTFHTISFTLKPFTFEEQKKFCNQYWRTQHENVNKFSERILNQVTDNNYEFIGIPSDTKLLAEVFKSDANKLKTDNVKFISFYEKLLEENNKLLYEHIQKTLVSKNKTLQKLEEVIAIAALSLNDSYIKDIDEALSKAKENILNINPEDCLIKTKNKYEEFQKMCALSALFEKRLLEKLEVDKSIDAYYNDLSSLDLPDVNHLVWKNPDTSQFSFVHQIFAKFLAAKWLYDNWKIKDLRDLIKCRFQSKNFFLFNLFDQYATENHPLHLSIILKNSNTTLELIKSNPEYFGSFDDCGRTGLHLLVCYGFWNDSSNCSQNVVIDEILDVIPENIDIEAKDNLLKYNSLDYAEKITMFSLDLKCKNNIFSYCEKFSYGNLFLKVCQYFAREELQLELVDPSTDMKTFCCGKNNYKKYQETYSRWQTVSEFVMNSRDRNSNEIMRHKT